MFTHCPKCGHSPLPADQALPAACPVCGVILAKMAQALQGDEAPTSARGLRTDTRAWAGNDQEERSSVFFHVPQRVDRMFFWLRSALLAALTIWGMVLIAKNYRTGEIGETFLHRPLLVFHEAGHVVFIPFGEWLTVLGGSAGQLIVPAILCGALLLKNRDPYGAAVGLWLFGVSLLDLAPYMYDALDPQLMLLSGTTGEAGGHDWIYLFTSMGVLAKSQLIGGFTHKLGAAVVLLALAWGAWVLRLQYERVDEDVLREE